MWDRTNILITSDHPFRGVTAFWRSREGVDWSPEEAATLRRSHSRTIPFLLKLAGQSHGITYDREFNTVLSHDLILKLLRGEVKTPEQVRDFIDQRTGS